MIVDYSRWCYTAPCRWYKDGPIGKIRFYFADEDAQVLNIPTVFWPYNQILDMENVAYPGEITGPGLRVRHNGANTNDLPGTHYEGTLADFAGEGNPDGSADTDDA